MNDSINDLFYIKIGSTNVLDGLYLVLISPLGFIGFSVNMLAYLIITKIQLRKKELKVYFQAYTLTSSLTCLLPAFLFLTRSPRYVSTFKSYYAGIYRCKIMPLNLTTYFFINLLDCFFLLERLSHFKVSLKKITSSSPYLIITFFACLCIFLDIPNYLTHDQRFEYEYEDVLTNYTKLIEFTYCKRNRIALFTIYPLVSIMIKDILLLIIEISLAIRSIILFKNYIKKIKLKDFEFEARINSMENTHIEQSNLSNFDTISNKAIQELKEFNFKLTKTTILLSICSIISHIGLLICYIIFFLNDNSILAHSSYMICLIILYLKCFSNFSVFYHFNKHFRNIFKNFFQ
jgi:hypothetical protein